MILRGNLIVICSSYKRTVGNYWRISEMNFGKRKQDKIILEMFTAKAVALFFKILLLMCDVYTEKRTHRGSTAW